MSTTSAEVSNKDKSVGKTSSEKIRSSLFSMNIYEGMLLLSLVFIILACFLMFMELNSFGNILTGAWPWRTVDAEIPPITQ